MRIFIVICSMLLALNLFSLTLTDGARTFTLTADSLRALPPTEIATVRDKDDTELHETWSGVSLETLLQHYGIDLVGALRFDAADRYMVLLQANELPGAILARARGGQPFASDQVRLVSANLPDMYWIQRIASITVVPGVHAPDPVRILNLEAILRQQAQRDTLPGFPGLRGWYFRDLARELNFTPDGTWFFQAHDGITQKLDYATYLARAVLVVNGPTVELKSPDMPQGMWLKDLATIQKDETLMVFTDRFANLGEVREFLHLKAIPNTVKVIPGYKLKTGLPGFDDPWWKTVRGVEW